MKNQVKKKKALIIGVSGQDGAYLSKFLIKKGYEVFGSSRDSQKTSFHSLKLLGVASKVHYLDLIPPDFNSVYQTISSIKPDEIYNLSGQSSVGLSFQHPFETSQSIISSTINILETIRLMGGHTRFYNAGSGEVFGETQGRPSNEKTAFNPVSPYGLAKANSTEQVSLYRNLYGLYTCTGILFNHESPLRPKSYVTQKIILAAYEIARDQSKNLVLGNIKIARDWGYAPEYVEAMWTMLQQESPDDFIIATGRTTTLETFIDQAFRYFNLNWNDHVSIDERLFRKSEIMVGAADPRKAQRLLGWRSNYTIENIVDTMIDFQIKRAKDNNIN